MYILSVRLRLKGLVQFFCTGAVNKEQELETPGSICCDIIPVLLCQAWCHWYGEDAG